MTMGRGGAAAGVRYENIIIIVVVTTAAGKREDVAGSLDFTPIARTTRSRSPALFNVV